MSSTDTPRYLFRTYSPGSEGSNGASGFLSTADCNSFSEARSLDHVSPRNARDILRDHITWQCPADDTLISFTSSFLFALQHAIRKIATCRRGTTEENCFISIIDTSKYPPGTFLSTLSLLEKYKLDETTDKFLLHEYHAAEYLAEDELSMLQGSSIHVSFATIISEGNLFSIMPELNVEAHKRNLIKRLEQLRLLWYYRERAITTQDIDKARKLALCFGDKWVPVIMIWALAMKARPQGVGLLEEEFADGFHGLSVRTMCVSELNDIRRNQNAFSIPTPQNRNPSDSEGARTMATNDEQGLRCSDTYKFAGNRCTYTTRGRYMRRSCRDVGKHQNLSTMSRV